MLFISFIILCHVMTWQEGILLDQSQSIPIHKASILHSWLHISNHLHDIQECVEYVLIFICSEYHDKSGTSHLSAQSFHDRCQTNLHPSTEIKYFEVHSFQMGSADSHNMLLHSTRLLPLVSKCNSEKKVYDKLYISFLWCSGLKSSLSPNSDYSTLTYIDFMGEEVVFY